MRKQVATVQRSWGSMSAALRRVRARSGERPCGGAKSTWKSQHEVVVQQQVEIDGARANARCACARASSIRAERRAAPAGSRSFQATALRSKSRSVPAARQLVRCDANALRETTTPRWARNFPRASEHVRRSPSSLQAIKQRGIGRATWEKHLAEAARRSLASATPNALSHSAPSECAAGARSPG